MISVYITEEIKEILEYLGSDDKEPNNFIFPILNKDMNPLQQHEAIHLFIALINNWMAVIAKKINLPRNPSIDLVFTIEFSNRTFL